MKINPLDYIPLEVRKLQSLKKNSKQYKKGIRSLRLRLWQYVLNILKQSKPGQLFYPLKVRRRKDLFICFFFVAAMTTALFVSGIIFSDINIDEFTEIEVIEASIFISIFIIFISIIIFFGYKSKKVIDECICILLDQAKVKCPNFSDDLLQSVSSAYQFTYNNHEIINTRQKCGCINCQTIFYSDQIKDINFMTVICPYCSTENVIGESSGYPISKDFLNAMKEYWINS